MLVDLKEMDILHPNFHTLISHLMVVRWYIITVLTVDKNLLEHMKEEEHAVLPQFKIVVGTEYLVHLGQIYEERKRKQEQFEATTSTRK
jgi:hypothetical protein